MGKSLGILNNIRSNASQEYQTRIPVATQENIASIGNALQQYTVLYNEFCEALINKIGKTILESKLFSNRLARFKQGTVLHQQDVEEIFIEMAKAEGAYDPTGPNPLGRREGPDVKAIYHRMNRQDVYVISIGDIDFVRVFRSEATLDSFIKSLINSVYSGASYDEWLAMKNLINTYKGYAKVGVDMDPNMEGKLNAKIGPEQVKQFVKTCKKLARDVTFPSRDYNSAGVMTWSDPSKMVLLVNKDLLAEVDVELLAHAFNQGKTDVPFEIIPMDDFGELVNIIFTSEEAETVFGNGTLCEAEVLGLLVDEDFLRVFDTLSHFEPQRNAHGLFTNYFYHVHQILSASTFKTAIAILGGYS